MVTNGEKSALDARLLALLVCPLTKQGLDYDAATNELVSRAAMLAFPIRDGIPILLLTEARAIGDPATGADGAETAGSNR